MSKKGLQALGLLALSTMACGKVSDLFIGTDPVAAVARGAIGSGLLMTELFGVKTFTSAWSDENIPWGVARLVASVVIPGAGAALSYFSPEASFFLFYIPLLAPLVMIGKK